MSRMCRLPPLLLAAALAFIAFTAGFASAQGAEVVIIPGLGQVKGLADVTSNSRAFRNIPYANSPAPPNRFKPPVAKQGWTGVLDATSFGPGCFSAYPGANSPEPMSEDCLSLNVFTPRNYSGQAAGKQLPVMVWFYGGSFSTGSGPGPLNMYDGSFMAGAEEVVVVTFNYRLSALGFLVTNEIAGNMGILDQRMVLQWVQRNIAAFNGDPARVTLFGESAGAWSIAIHLTSPASYAYYNKAILFSHPIGVRMQQKKGGAIYGREFCRLQGCLTTPGTGDQYTCSTSCLQGTTSAAVKRDLIATLANSTVVTEANKEHLLDQLLGFKPVVDGSIVPNNFMELLESSKLNPNAQIIVGTTADEAAVFAYQIEKPPAITMTQYSLATIAIFGANKGAKLGYYYSRFFTDGFAALSRTVTDMWFRCSMQKFVTVQQKLSGKQAYVYRYTHVFESPDVFDYFEFPKECRTQVCHAAELPFVFHFEESKDPKVKVKMTTAEKALSRQMVKYIANFARSGDPNTDMASSVDADNAANDARFVRTESQRSMLARLRAAGLLPSANSHDNSHSHSSGCEHHQSDADSDSVAEAATPTATASPNWPKWNPETRENVVFQTGFATENSKELCTLWDTIGYIVPYVGSESELAATAAGFSSESDREQQSDREQERARAAALLAMPRTAAALRSGDLIGAFIAAAEEASGLEESLLTPMI